MGPVSSLGLLARFRRMAPEVVLGMPYTEKVDVYSFGLLLWQMTSGEAPFVSGCAVDTQAGAMASQVRGRANGQSCGLVRPLVP